MKILGRHLVAELADCNIEFLNDLPFLEQVMKEAARISGATVVKTAFHRYNPQGLSGIVVIAESHLSIHTWPEYGYAAVDYFTCGDSVKVAVDLSENRVISRVRFDGDGCAISTSSASMMTELLKGKSLDKALKIVGNFMDFMTGHDDSTLEDWGELEALEGVRQFPQRVKCATLPWHAVEHTLKALAEKY